MASLDSQQQGHNNTTPEYQEKINTTMDAMSKEMPSTCITQVGRTHTETLMITISKLHTENKDAHESFQLTLQQKEEENEKLLKKQETEISQLQQESFNKAQMIVQGQERIKEQNDKKEEVNRKFLKNIAEDNLTIKVQETEISQLQQEPFNKAQMIVQVQKRIKELEEQNNKREEENGKFLKRIAENNLSMKVQETKISQLEQESLSKAQMIVQVQERIKELEEQNGKKEEENGNLLKKIAEDKLAIKLKETEINQLQQEVLDSPLSSPNCQSDTVLPFTTVKRLIEEHANELELRLEKNVEEFRKNFQQLNKDAMLQIEEVNEKYCNW